MNKNLEQDYQAWKKRMLGQLPLRMECMDCNGSGTGECPECGHETDCDTCGGTGETYTAELLDKDFYQRVMAFEQAMYEHWINGDALHVEKGKSPLANPLNRLLEQVPSEPKPNWWDVDNVPKVVLHIHAV